MAFEPRYAVLNVIASRHESTLPLRPTVVLLPSVTEHWLFWSVPATPSVPVVHCVAASFSRETVLAALLYRTRHDAATVPAPVVLNHAYVEAMSVAPAVSAYWNVNDPLLPEPL